MKNNEWSSRGLEVCGSREKQCLQEVVNAVDQDADGAGDGRHDNDAGAHHPDHLPVAGLQGGQDAG